MRRRKRKRGRGERERESNCYKKWFLEFDYYAYSTFKFFISPLREREKEKKKN